MLVNDMIIQAETMINELYNTRKDVTKSFEFDYIHKLTSDYNILKNSSNEWILQNRETLQQSVITITTKKEDNQVYLNSIEHKIINNIYKFQ